MVNIKSKIKKMITVKGRLVNILGRNVAIAQEPTYPVVKYITKQEADNFMHNIMSKYVVTESLQTLQGEKIIVHYIKSSKCKS